MSRYLFQVLADSYSETEISFKQKSSYFFISYLPPKWQIQSLLADVLASIGSIKSALEIYIKLQDWENVIFCYNVLQMRHKVCKKIVENFNKS